MIYILFFMFAMLPFIGNADDSIADQELAWVNAVHQTYHSRATESVDDLVTGCFAPGWINPNMGMWHFSLKGDFIYWRVAQENMDLGIYQTGADNGTDTVRSTLYQSSHYEPGFRLHWIIGTNRDSSSVYANYARLVSNYTTSLPMTGASKGDNNYSFLPNTGWTVARDLHPFDGTTAIPNVFFTSFSSKWRTTINRANICLQRPSYEGTAWIVKPRLGLALCWIKQNMEQSYTLGALTNSVATSRFSSSNALVGPVAKCDIKFSAWYGFSMIAKFGVAAMYENMKARGTLAVLTNLTTLGTSRYVRDRFKRVVPHVMGALGIRWGSYFNNEDWPFNLEFAADYEFQRYWAQNGIRKMLVSQNVPPSATIATTYSNQTIPLGALLLHGITVGINIGF